ncbi:MAG: ABC transporter permease [Clostridia bacterium]|nr:ABC transporter permease [Clostridia bacterium]
MNKIFAHGYRAVKNCIRYFPLLQNLISRNLKKKYRRSVLGYIWCVLNPLMVMLIMNFVFSSMFRSSIDNYPVYLFAGRMMFFFITGSTQSMAGSIISNGSLMRKTRVPYHIFTLANFCSQIVDFGFSLIAFAIVLLITKTPITVHVLAFPAVVLEMFLFCYGLGMFLAQTNTFIRDVSYIYGLVTTAWMYLTPIFYSVEIMPANAHYIITHFNPAYAYLQMSRLVFLYHQWPTRNLLVSGFLWGALMTVVGVFTYIRSKDKLILYV